MKKSYITPATAIHSTQPALPLAVSNVLNGQGIHTNSDTMEEGDGDDAAIKGNAEYWDFNW